MSDKQIRFYNKPCSCGTKVKENENYATGKNEVLCRSCREIQEGRLVDGRPIASALPTELLVEELKKREAGNLAAKAREKSARSLRFMNEINSLLNLTPFHTEAANQCNDTNLSRAFGVTSADINDEIAYVCPRCTLLKMEQNGEWSNHVDLKIKLVCDSEVRDLADKISAQI